MSADLPPISPLAESQKWLSQVVEFTRPGMYTCDTAGRITMFNRRAAEIWGREPRLNDDEERFCGSLRLCAVGGTLIPRDQIPMASAVRDGVNRSVEAVVERPDATRRLVTMSIAPLYDGDGRRIGAINVFHDITDRKTAEAAAGESQERSRELIRKLPVAVYTCDAQGRVTFYNNAAAELWGREPELGKDLWCGSLRVYNPDGSPLAFEACPIAVALKEGRGVHGQQIVIERPDGTRRLVVPHPEPLRNEAGTLVGAINMLLDVTETRSAEQAQSLLAAIVTSSNDAIISEDPDGTITSWNAAAERIFGYAAPEAIGRPMTMLIPADRLDEEGLIRARLRRGERIAQLQTVRHAKGGRALDVSLSVSPIRDRRGRVIGASTVARDITDQMNQESAQAHLGAIVASSDDAIISKTLDGTITSWNAGAARMFGYTAEEAVGRPISMLIPPARLAEERDILARLRRGERIGHFKTVRLTKDGREIDVSLTISPVRNSAGRIIGASKAARDVSEQHRADEALRRSESNLADFFENATIGLHWVDAGGMILRANRAELEMLGYTREEYVGRHIAEFHVDKPVIDDLLARLARGENVDDWPARVRRKDGTVRHVLINSSVLWEGERFVHTRCFTRDVTDQVLARTILENQQAVLEGAVRARTEELRESHEHLRISERMASLGTLSAGFGHDMGNLLVPVRVYVECLERADLPPDLREDVRKIKSAAEQLQSLANGLRLMALDPEKARANETTELGSWWKDAAPVTKNALPRGIALESNIPAGTSVAMPRAALTQAVFGLVQNAGEAMRGLGTGVVRLSARREGDTVVVSVQDTGTGMTPEVRARCLEPFFTTKVRGTSTGLGLVLVSGLVRRAGGTVDIDSTPGKGTTFRLTLPCAAPWPSVMTRRAVVDLKDARTRAYVAAELRELAFGVVTAGEAGAAPADLWITDSSNRTVGGARPASKIIVVALDERSAPKGAVVIGKGFDPGGVRREIRTAVEGLFPAEAPARS